MKRYLISAACALALSACATAPSTFGPADGSDFGYQTTRIQQDRFRVSYTSGNADRSRDYALLRAAQIADETGYSHFQVVDAYYDDNEGRRSNSRVGVGVGVGSGGYRRSGVSTGLSIGVSDISGLFRKRKATETIEVILLDGAPQTDNPAIYSARDVIQNIVPTPA